MESDMYVLSELADMEDEMSQYEKTQDYFSIQFTLIILGNSDICTYRLDHRCSVFVLVLKSSFDCQ
jgi:hypothetical protein